MPTIRVTRKSPASEVRKQLRVAMASLDPHKELQSLRRLLQRFERKFGMSSEEFLAKYEQGEMDDEADTMRWVMHYKTFLRLSEMAAEKKKAA